MEGYYPLANMDTSEKWLVVQTYHQGRQPQVLEALGGENSAILQEPSYLFKYYLHPIDESLQFPFDDFKQCYRNVLLSVPKNSPFRPQILHPKQRVLGSQTAIVTGAAGEEIYCDEYGRIKVLFHWDRINPQNEHSSHWIRVASNWAHDGYGTVVIPRVGMEVKVDFLEGDIDNPIVTGAIHNGVNKVPYDLPANKTRSVFKTSSSKGGVGSNEFRVEDKTGQEQIFVQAQKDFDQLTKHNHTTQVNNNSHLQVNNEHSENIKANRYTKNEAEEHHLIEQDRKTQILLNDYKEVGISEHATVGTIYTCEAGQEIHLKATGQVVVDGGLSLTLNAGGQHIVLNPAGIWMTMPVWTGGVPMEGTPAVPIPPLSKFKGVNSVAAPPVTTTPLEEYSYNLKYHLTNDQGKPYSNTQYIALLPNNQKIIDITDQNGYTQTFHSGKPEKVRVHLYEDYLRITKGIGIVPTPVTTEAISQDDHNLQFQLTNDDGTPYANKKYMIILPDNQQIIDTTDENGLTKTLYSQNPEKIAIRLYKGDESITKQIKA